jgi:hypothetical protein
MSFKILIARWFHDFQIERILNQEDRIYFVRAFAMALLLT